VSACTCESPEKYGHSSHCPYDEIATLTTRIAELEAQRDNYFRLWGEEKPRADAACAKIAELERRCEKADKIIPQIALRAAMTPPEIENLRWTIDPQSGKPSGIQELYRASSACPLCGVDEPHAHTVNQLKWLRHMVAYLEQKLGVESELTTARAESEALRADRDEWKQQHENLLAVRQQDLAAFDAKMKKYPLAAEIADLIISIQNKDYRKGTAMDLFLMWMDACDAAQAKEQVNG